MKKCHGNSLTFYSLNTLEHSSDTSWIQPVGMSSDFKTKFQIWKQNFKGANDPAADRPIKYYPLTT